MTTTADKPYCSGRSHHGRMGFVRCSRRASVVRDGTPYCASHDPERVRARSEAWQKKYDAEKAERDAIYRDALAMIKRLGAGQPHYGTRGYTRAIVLTFEDAEALIARLAEPPQ